MANIQSANLNLWVYEGVFGQKATQDPKYTIYKEKISTNDIIIFEVAELVRDYINIEFDGDYNNIKQNVWVEWEITRVFDNGTSDDFPIEGFGIAFDGFGYFEEGINPQLSKGLLQTNTIMYVKAGDLARIPIYTDSDGTFKVEYYKAGSLLVSNTYGVTVTKVSVDTTDYTTDSGVITTDTAFIKNQTSNPSTTSIASGSPDTAIIVGTDGTETIVYINYLTECKYEPNKVSFTNKFGVIQDIYFFKRRDDSMSVSKDSFKANTLNFGATDLSYSINKAQNKDFNVNGTKSLKLNTGYVDEQFGAVMKEVLMSENVWIHEDEKVYPIKPRTNSLQLKKSVNDKLIDYALEFDYSFDIINSIR